MREAALAADARIVVEYADETRVGGPLSPKLQNSFRTLFAPIYRALDEGGPEYVIANVERLMGDVRGEPLFETLRDSADRLRIAPDVLYPDESRIYPIAVNVERADSGERLRLMANREILPLIHDVISGWSGDPAAELEDVATAESLDAVARQRGLLVDAPPRLPSLPAGDITFLGHNAVRIASDSAAVLVDPWLAPRSARYGEYQPLTRRQLGPMDAILLTHSHPDHFDPGSLLQFHRRTRIVVPRIERESLLSANLSLRLRELGFENVEPLDWWSETTIGDITVAALPFYGEQPTNSGQICPEVRMMGNTYLVRTPRVCSALVADSGRDRDGDVREVALTALRRWGPIDVLFSGYRGWSLYPIQYFESSVRQYLLFVPQYLYPVRQSIMNGAAEAVDTAEAWHATYLAPYGDGGAPWYSDLGLGPDPRTAYGEDAPEWVHFDPLPERCLEELRARSSPVPGVTVGSRVKPLLLRPGQSVRLADGQAEVLEIEGHRWLYGNGVLA